MDRWSARRRRRASAAFEAEGLSHLDAVDLGGDHAEESTADRRAAYVVSAFRRTVTDVVSGFSRTVTDVVSAFRRTVTDVVSAFRRTVTDVVSAFRRTVTDVVSGFSRTLKNPVERDVEDERRVGRNRSASRAAVREIGRNHE